MGQSTPADAAARQLEPVQQLQDDKLGAEPSKEEHAAADAKSAAQPAVIEALQATATGNGDRRNHVAVPGSPDRQVLPGSARCGYAENPGQDTV